jgi:hypothetical protein
MIKKGFTYKGHTYDPYEDVEYGDEGPENVKIYHYFNIAGGKEVSMDWSPYSTPNEEDVKLWVDLGNPVRIGGGPLDSADLKIIEQVQALRADAARLYSEGKPVPEEWLEEKINALYASKYAIYRPF